MKGIRSISTTRGEGIEGTSKEEEKSYLYQGKTRAMRRKDKEAKKLSWGKRKACSALLKT